MATRTLDTLSSRPHYLRAPVLSSGNYLLFYAGFSWTSPCFAPSCYYPGIPPLLRIKEKNKSQNQVRVLDLGAQIADNGVMSANESTITLPSLTDLEKQVLRDLLPSFADNGEDFSYTGDITVPMSKARGCLSSLSQKGILVVWPEETNCDGISYNLVQWASDPKLDPDGRAMSRAVRAAL